MGVTEYLVGIVSAGLAVGCQADDLDFDARDGDVLPSQMVLHGTIRDFRKSHIDMEYSKFGLDAGYTEPVLGPDNKPVYRAELGSSYSTHGPDSYYEWYHDVPGVNQPSSLPITLEKVSDNPALYAYHNSSFFPIDGQLFGNEGNAHNYHFTFEIHTTFTYRGGEQFTFIGDDDVLVYVNRHKVIDIGGIHAQLTRTVNLDEVATDIGLIEGGTYRFDLFFAERHTVASNFKIETSIANFAACDTATFGGAGLVGLDSVDVSGTPIVTGEFPSVYSNGPITLSGNFTVDGDVVSGDQVWINGGNVPVGSIIENANPISVPDPTSAVEAASAENDNDDIPCVKRGNKCKSPVKQGKLVLKSQDVLTLSSGTYYFPKGIDISGQAQLDVDGTVFAYVEDGVVTLNGGSATNPALNSLSVISSSADDVKLNGGGSTKTRIYAPFATVRFSGTHGFNGSAVGRELVISGTADLNVTDDELSSLATTLECENEGDSGEPPELPELPD